MVNDNLHIICGNCGCSTTFSWEYCPEFIDYGEGSLFPEVILKCRNCSTVHPLSKYMEEVKAPKKEFTIPENVTDQINHFEENIGLIFYLVKAKFTPDKSVIQKHVVDLKDPSYTFNIERIQSLPSFIRWLSVEEMKNMKIIEFNPLWSSNKRKPKEGDNVG